MLVRLLAPAERVELIVARNAYSLRTPAVVSYVPLLFNVPAVVAFVVPATGVCVDVKALAVDVVFVSASRPLIVWLCVVALPSVVAPSTRSLTLGSDVVVPTFRLPVESNNIIATVDGDAVPFVKIRFEPFVRTNMR